MAYLSSGVVSIEGTSGITMGEKFFEAFFFSVQTFTTVGYGHLTPKGIVGNLIATLDAFVGLISFALATGLLFARFSKPTAKILFSKQAIIAPHRGITAFEFRLANARSNQLVEVEVKVLFSEMEMVKSNRKRRFRDLPLERNKVAFLPLHLTVVHPIDETSPLNGLTMEDLEKSDAEFLVLITAVDETFSQTVHARSSYKYSEIVWGAKFRDIFHYSNNGIISVDLRCIHDIDKLEVAEM